MGPGCTRDREATALLQVRDTPQRRACLQWDREAIASVHKFVRSIRARLYLRTHEAKNRQVGRAVLVCGGTGWQLLHFTYRFDQYESGCT